MTGVPLPVVQTGPEALLRLGRVYADGELVRGSMPTGPWLCGPGARVTLGSLGVLIDNVLGYAIIAHRPPQHWSVSTEISMDLLEPLPTDGAEVHATARVVHADEVGGFAIGEVVDEAGRLLATCRQRGRYVPSGDDPQPVAFELPDDVPDLATLLGAAPLREGTSLEVTGVLENPMHNLHGGIALSLADLAASWALTDDGPPLVTASIHTGYARAVPGGSRLALETVVRHRGRTLATVDVTGLVDGRTSLLSRVTAQRPS